jgi:hypothetical protein|tara:strand:+ start:2509 stop:2727 length:219 start_codon:yes stop_codon:yes gene_type:complete
MAKWQPRNDYTPIAVVYTKGAGKKFYIKVFTSLACVDKIISPRSKYMPENTTIEAIGQGTVFEERYRAKYKI